MSKEGDLRFKRTEAAIRRAFLSIVGEGDPSPSASDICRRAGISRNAFYLHHAGVPALCQTLVDEIVSDIRTASIDSVGRFAESRSSDPLLAGAIAETLARHEAVLRALLPAADGTIAASFAKALEDVYIEAARPLKDKGDGRGHRLSCAWGAWAVIGFTLRWFEETSQPLADGTADFIRLQQPLTDATSAYLSE